MDFEFDFDSFLTIDVAATLVLVLSLVVVRAIAGQAIKRRTDTAAYVQRRWAASVRNALFFIGLVGVILIWAPQLRTFALSLTAVAVAIVVATKELILCLSGGFLRASSRSFGVGDWIEVAGIRGEVIDLDVLATTLQEFAESPAAAEPTGRTVVVPNSVFLSSPVRNQTALREHTFHHFAITLEPAGEIFRRRAVLEEVVQRHYAPYRDPAVRANAAMERRTGSDLPDPTPRIRFGTTDLGKYRIDITVFCPPEASERLQDEITWEILEHLQVPSETRTSATDEAAVASPPEEPP